MMSDETIKIKTTINDKLTKSKLSDKLKARVKCGDIEPAELTEYLEDNQTLSSYTVVFDYSGNNITEQIFTIEDI